MINNVVDKNIENEKKKHPHRNVSIIIIKDKMNRILLVRTKKLPNHWQPIGGGVQLNELPIDTIIRELYEETGLILSSGDILKITELPYDFGEGIIYCYCSKKIVDDYVPKISRDEIEEYKWFTLEEAELLPKFKATETFINELIKLRNGD